MSTDPDARWYQFRRVRLSAEYVGGTLAGFGLGAMLGCYLAGGFFRPGWNPFLVIPGFALVAIGGYLAYRSQQKPQRYRN